MSKLDDTRLFAADQVIPGQATFGGYWRVVGLRGDQTISETYHAITAQDASDRFERADAVERVTLVVELLP